MKNTYGDIFHKPMVIKQKENDVMTQIIKEIQKYAVKHYEKIKSVNTVKSKAVEKERIIRLRSQQSIKSARNSVSSSLNKSELEKKKSVISFEDDVVCKKVETVKENTFENEEIDELRELDTIKIKRFSLIMPHLYMKTSFQLLKNIISMFISLIV